MGFFAPTDLAPSARAACDHAVGYIRLRTLDDPMYLRVSPQLTASEGIRGTVASRDDRGRTGTLAAFGLFITVVIGLVVLQRKLAYAARLEHAERVIEAEYARLEETVPRKPRGTPETRGV